MFGNALGRTILTIALATAVFLSSSPVGAANPPVLVCGGIIFSFQQILLASELDENLNLAKPKGKFVYFLIEAANNGKTQKNIKIGMFNIIDQSGNLHRATQEASVSLQFPPVNSLLSELLKPGEKVRFALGFDLPSDIRLNKLKLQVTTEGGKTASIDVEPTYRSVEKRQ